MDGTLQCIHLLNIFMAMIMLLLVIRMKSTRSHGDRLPDYMHELYPEATDKQIRKILK